MSVAAASRFAKATLELGGLVAGAWIGVLFAPTRVPTMGSLWQLPSGITGTAGPATTALLVPRIAGVLALLGLMAAAYAMGVSAWS